MDKETKALINLYHNRIKDLEDINKEKQDHLNNVLNDCDLLQHKLDKIEEYITNHKWLLEIEQFKIAFNPILQIIKGEDK